MTLPSAALGLKNSTNKLPRENKAAEIQSHKILQMFAVCSPQALG